MLTIFHKNMLSNKFCRLIEKTILRKHVIMSVVGKIEQSGR
jgi:hypothetical protein